MEEDARLQAQLRSLGKKMFQFRDLVSKIEIPDTVPPAPYDQIFWDMFVKKCASAMTVLKQVQSALIPDLHHLAVYPGEKIWRNPAAVPDLLGLPEHKERPQADPIAVSRAQIQAWNSVLEQATSSLEEYLEGVKFPTAPKSGLEPEASTLSESDKQRILRLFTMTSEQRVATG